MKRLHICLAFIFSIVSTIAIAAPLAKQDLPAFLQDWLPWALHGHEQTLCPLPYNNETGPVCVWPSNLWVDASPNSGRFRYEVNVLGAASAVVLPGQATAWPQDVLINGTARPVVAIDDAPATWLEPGSYTIEGRWPWSVMPAELTLPKGVATIQVLVDGVVLSRKPDGEGRILLRSSALTITTDDELKVNTARLIDDQVPMSMTTHYDLVVSGKPRDIELPAALWPQWVALAIESPLPVRLQADGKLVVQVRAGQWTVVLRARKMMPAQSLTLPSQAVSQQEYWSFQANNDVRLVTVKGVSVDPTQVPVPTEWQHLPTYRVLPGETLNLVESRRGNSKPSPDNLKLHRDLWLDFDGRGWSVRDDIQGQLNRSSRLNANHPYTLGRVVIDGQDQPITYMHATASKPSKTQSIEYGVEVRQGQANIVAESRVAGGMYSLPAAGWSTDFQKVSAVLHLPPGWRLIHAWGVDFAKGSWLSQWTSWDFFFVFLSSLAALHLLGWVNGVCLGLALILTWHMSSVPQYLWLAFLAARALQSVLPQGRLFMFSRSTQQILVAITGLMILPYAVTQVRLTIHPVLEMPHQALGGQQERLANSAPRDKSAESVTEVVVSSPDARVGTSAYSIASKKTLSADDDKTAHQLGNELFSSEMLVDPSARVQTGSGLPTWVWKSHVLDWSGPVQAEQMIHFLLFPPWATACLRMLGLILLIVAWFRIMQPMAYLPEWFLKKRFSKAKSLDSLPSTIIDSAHHIVACLFLLSMFSVGVPQAMAQAPIQPEDAKITLTEQNGQIPGAALLEELRSKVNRPPECLPLCADIPRMQIVAGGAKVQLILEIHVLANVSVPLPGQGNHWLPKNVSINGTLATTRRDAAGVLWIMLSTGVHRVMIESDVGDASTVDITLPMPVHQVQATSTDWQVSGIAPEGKANTAVSLIRRLNTEKTDHQPSIQADVLSPFVRIERTLRLGMRWQVETRIQRVAPSMAPLQVSINLLDGEVVNNPNVQVHEGIASLTLGTEAETIFLSTLQPLPRLELTSLNIPHQIEVWRLDASPQWNVKFSGIAPVLLQADSRLLPTWQPWPGEKVVVEVIKPKGIEGQILTVDQTHTEVKPGLRVTDVDMHVSLRASQGGNHRVLLPHKAAVLAVSMNGQVIPIQPKGSELIIPITPGAHQLLIKWQEPRGIEALFGNRAVNLGTSGVNDSVRINIPKDRVVLATSGPLIGPTVLFWGVFFVVVGMAIALSRWRASPLNVLAFTLLGLGLAQMSIWGMAFVFAWFLTMEARRHMRRPLSKKWEMIRQIGLAIFSFAVAAVLLETVRVGLLGYPNFMVLGNGSDANQLNWYADRFEKSTATATVFSIPLYVYRILMLLWALWLAVSVLRWLNWAWTCFSADRYWPQTANDSEPKQP